MVLTATSLLGTGKKDATSRGYKAKKEHF